MTGFYALWNALVLGVALRYVRQAGLHSVIPFGLCVVLLSLYCLITPGYFYLIGRETVTGDSGAFRQVGKSIVDYYESGMLAYALANTCFVLGFVGFGKPAVRQPVTLRPEALPGLRRFTLLLYVVCMGIVLIDIALTGINPLDVLFRNTDETLFSGQTGLNSYYFRAFADSLVVIIILYAYLRGSKLGLLALLVPAFVLFALLGFRYRLLLTVLGLLLVYWLDGRLRLSGLRLAGLSVGLLYFVMAITYNRWLFLRGELADLTFDPGQFEYEALFEQTRGSLVDFNLLRYYDENPAATHDYGLSMFGYVLVRAIPKPFFDGGEKPYPSPFLDMLDKSLELPAHWARIGEATLHYGAFFAGFGWAGFVLLPLLMGAWLRFFVARNPATEPLGFIKQIAFSLALFQFITRGYFPQFVDHYVYFFIPIWLLSRSVRQATQTVVSENQVHHEVVY